MKRLVVLLVAVATASAKGGIYAAAFVGDWLGSMITDRVAAGVLTRHGLRLTPANLPALTPASG